MLLLLVMNKDFCFKSSGHLRLISIVLRILKTPGSENLPQTQPHDRLDDRWPGCMQIQDDRT